MIRSIHRFWLRTVTLIMIAVSCGCAHTPLRQHPDFAGAARKVQSVAVLPPDVEYYLLSFSGDNERLPDEENSVTQHLNNIMPTLLDNYGYTAREFSVEKLQKFTKDVSFTLQQVKSAYNEISRQLYEKDMGEEEAKTVRVSLGPMVNPFFEALNADGLFVVRYVGLKKSEGLVAKEVVSTALLGALFGLVVIPRASNVPIIAVEMALIDATTGDVLWVNRGRNIGQAIEKLPRAYAPVLTSSKPTNALQ